jgi:hypothetical protein
MATRPYRVRGHVFDSEWEGVMPGGRREIALICRRCKLRVDDPRWHRNQDGKDVCYTVPKEPTCNEQVVVYIMES